MHPLEKCHYQIMIPANPDYSSLNLAQSLQIVAYELRKAFFTNLREQQNENVNEDLKEEEIYKKIKEIKIVKDTKKINILQMEGFYHHLKNVLLKINFLDPAQSPHLMTLLRRLFNKADLDQEELNILRGILTAIEKRV